MAPTISNLQEAATITGDGAAIISATGTSNAFIMPLLNKALSLDLSGDGDSTASRSGRRDVSPTLFAAGVTDGPLVFVLEELDGTALDEASVADALALAVSLAGVIVLSARMHDMARAHAAGVTKLMGAIERALSLRASGAVPVLPRRRLIVLAVTEFDENEASEDEVRSSVEELLSNEYDAIEVPSRLSASSLSDIFDVRVAMLRSATHRPDAFEQDVKQLGDVLREANKAYADAGLSASNIPSLVDKSRNALVDGFSRDLPNEAELHATFACDSAMQSALERFRNFAKAWKARVDAKRIVGSFGSENDKQIVQTLEIYDNDASSHKDTSAFARKRNELKTCLLSDSYTLFTKQILLLRENAYQLFRTKLARIRINDQVEKNVRGAVREAEMFFVENGELLRSKLGNWRFDNDRHELVNHMREDATERLQVARLQGNYVPNIRAPIAFAFHTLLQSPFGSDSRFAHPHAEEMKQSFDPDKVKQPGMMRTRPYQRGHPFKFKKSHEMDDESLDFYGEFFGESSNKDQSEE